MHSRLTTLLAATALLGMAGTAGAKTHLTASCDADNSNKHDEHHQTYSDQGQHKDRGHHYGMEQGRDDDQGEDEGNHKDEGRHNGLHNSRGHHRGGSGGEGAGGGSGDDQGGGSGHSQGGGTSVGVPEPATLALMGLGLLGCAVRSRRR